MESSLPKCAVRDDNESFFLRSKMPLAVLDVPSIFDDEAESKPSVETVDYHVSARKVAKH
jgi:hypothetical protein